MQIASTTAPVAAPAAPANGTLLFDGQHRIWDDEDPVRGRSYDVRMYRGHQAGSATGYGSLEAAIKAASFLTGETDGLGHTAVAAVANGARYDLFYVNERFRSGGSFAVPAEHANYEYHEDWIAHRAVEPSYEQSTLRALVDGQHVQRFHPGAVAPGVRP